MAQTAQVILEEMKKGVFHPLYFLQGEEPFFIDQIRQYAEEHALDPAERGFNQIILYGKETTMGNIMVQARRFPMMAQRQLVVIREAQEIQDFGKEEAQKLLMKYAESPVESTILLFAYKYKKLDGRKELGKVLDKKAILFHSEKVKDYQLTEWISAYLRTCGLQTGSGAAQLLADHLGNDLSRIANEVEKVKSSMKEGQELSRELILEKIGISKEYNVFELQSAIATRNLAKAIRITDYFIANPKSAALIPNLALLFGYFSKLLQIHDHPGVRDDELARKLGIHPYIFKEYRAAAGRFSKNQVLSAMHQIRLADGMAKGLEAGEKDERAIYRELLIQILRN
jgi:DNA polymerase-3 subunit delta